MRVASRPGSDGVPLVDRPAQATLFWQTGASAAIVTITAAQFIGAAARLAALLPDRPAAMLCCRQRLAFALGFAACALRGQVAVLAEQAPGGIGDAYRLTDSGRDGFTFDPAALLAGAPWSAEPPLVPAHRLAAIVATSGSTGQPVAHEKPFGALVQRSRAAGERFGLHETDPSGIVGTVPPQHMYGLETTILLPLHAACASWCGAAFYPLDVQAALAAIPAPRLLVTTPLQLRAFLTADVDLPPLAGIVSATAPIDTALATAAEQRWRTELHEIFGATELGSIASRRTVAGDTWEIYPGVALRPDGADFRVEAAHAAPARLDDAIEHHPGNRFRLLGRHTDLVKLGGRRASLAGLNRILNAVPGVTDGVFLAPDDLAPADLDSRPTARMLAFVVAPDHTPAEILHALRGRIDPVFLPRRIVKLDRLPRNEIGKLPRQALAALVDA